MNELRTIENSIKRLEAMYDCNHEYMDADDIGELLITIEDLKRMKVKLQHDEYVKNVEAFRDYVVSTMPFDDDDDTKRTDRWKQFYSNKFTICYGTHTVTLENSAEVYQAIVDTLNEHLDCIK